MKVGVIGNGGREHALCFSLKNSNKIKKFIAFQAMQAQVL